jgi:prolyl oligopeptidase
MFKRSTLGLTFVVLVLANLVLAQDKPPVAPVRDVTDEYFGQKVVDPYRWMEDLKSEELTQWMKAQADYTRHYLDRLPVRQELEKRLTELFGTGVRVSTILRRGDRYFYYKIAPGETSQKLYVRDGLDGTERLLVDPDKLAKGGTHVSITNYSPSQDGKLVSFLISPGGAEVGEIRVMDVATGKEIGDRIGGTRWVAGAWLPDGRSFTYEKLPQLPPNSPGTEGLRKIRVYQHKLGEDVEKDRAIFGYGVNPSIKIEPGPIPFSVIPRLSKYAFAFVNSGVSPNSEIYVAPVSSLEKAPIPWRKIADLSDEVTADLDVHGDELYLLTYKNTPRYKVIRIDLKNPDLSKAKTVFPASEAVVRNFGVAKDALYVETLDGGVPRLWRVEYNDRKPQPLKLPYAGAAVITQRDIDFSISLTEPDKDGILFGLYWFTKPFALYTYDPKTGNSTDTKLVPPIPVDMSGIDAYFAKARSYDGTMIPMAILHKKELKRDGSNPTLLLGYGAYGFNAVEPRFAAPMLAWLERGGVFVIAGVRGGGEYGEEWHQAAFQKTKQNTWKDFIAAAEYLIREKYTSPQHLSGWGGSAGGILICNAIAERPDLFGAAWIAVGVNNPLRFETTESGLANTAEFGSVKTEDGFKALLAMDGYHKIKDGVKYPAVLLTHGSNDPRVPPWMSAKMAARLQGASTSGKPVLLRIDYDAGHGIGSSRKQNIEERADVFAFLFEMLGSKTNDTANNARR